MEPDRRNEGSKPGAPAKGKNPLLPKLVIALAIVLIFSWIYSAISDSKYTETTYSDFLAALEAGELAEVELRYDRILYMTKEEAAKEPQQQKACYTGLPSGGDTMALAEELDALGITVSRQIVEDNSLISMVLSYAVMFGGLILLMNIFGKRMGGDGMMGGFGKSKAKVYMEKKTGVTFRDVAGQDEAKESL